MTIFCWILFRMRNVSDKVVEKIKTHISHSITSFRKSCRLWDNVEKCGGNREAADDNLAARCMLDARKDMPAHAHPHPYSLTHTWARPPPSHTHTHKYVILTAFPRQQWFRKRASMLRYRALFVWTPWLHHIFRHYLTNGTIFEKKLLNIKCVFWFSIQLLFEIFPILKRILRDVVINVKMSSYKYPLFLSDFNKTWIFSTNFRKKTPKISNLIKIRPVGV